MTGRHGAARWSWLGLAIAGALGVVCQGCQGRGEAETPPEIAKVERRDLEIRAEASGAVEPLRVVEVKSRVAGELKSILVETGDEVQQGALLAQVDPRDVENALAQARADLEVAKARVATISAQRRRSQELHETGVLSAQDYENVALTETNARAEMLKAQTNLELASERRGDVSIRAPITGTVIQKTVEQGSIIASASGNVSGGTTLVQMADLSTMQARALVDEVDIGRIHPGQPVEVTVEAYPGRVFRGTVFKIEPQAVVEQNVTMFPVLVHLANPERLLKPGMNAEVGIAISKREDVVAVPNSAVVAPRDAPAAGAVLGLEEADVRARLARLRGARGGGDGQRGDPARPRQARSGAHSGESAAGPDSPAPAGARPGVVFVRGAAGPEPRGVLLGLSDWDHTEVLRGLAPGDSVYLLSVARMQQQQERFTNRMRQSTGFGASGGGGGQGGGGSRGGGRP